ncbi:MAG: serine/threonine protein kinase, partial [Planctomycetota bacterium]
MSPEADSSNPIFTDLVGKEMAGCEVLSKLGQGAMGIVYLAEQINLKREVAIKVLDAKFSRDLVYIERFEREAQACARLVHFNVVQVYDFGRFNDIYYIISEYVDGSNAQCLIDEQGSIGFIEATDMVLQAARGLSAAGEAGIVHRDIKPENLMLTKTGVVKIADFGLAKVVQDDAAVTQSGMILGTPFYMSPEQARGVALDPRSDLYSLGVTYYHMLTGQIPFDGDSVISVLLKHISAERPDPAALNPSIPSIVSEVAMKMMAREPDHRYQSGVELVPVLEELLFRLKRGDYGEDTTEGKESVEAVASIDPERIKRYKLLPADQISSLATRAAAPAAVATMKSKIKTDAGVFIENDEIW